LAALWYLGKGVVDAQVLGLPTLGVSGGLFSDDPSKFQPLLFAWRSRIYFYGENWYPNDILTIHLYGPLNTLGVTPSDYVLGLVYADSAGNIVPGIDYSPSLQVLFSPSFALRPGYYMVSADDAPNLSPGSIPLPVAVARDRINIAPETTIIMEVPDVNGIHRFIFWPKSRGGRNGFPEIDAPERGDPEWVSVWSEQPVGLYATVAETDMEGGNQPAFISHEEFPGTHYAHDVNLELLPDPEYRWVLGTANFTSKVGEKNYGRMEFEWEAQNNGDPYSYGQGDIGMPLWVIPSAGDRIYTVGRWALDNGHPETGDRTEIHPARLLTTIRKRDTAVQFFGASCLTRAQQVDIFVSGHGGGSNRFPDGLSAATNNNGLGGGRLEDVLPSEPGNDLLGIYYAFGPASGFLLDLVALFKDFDRSQIREVAGPSGVGWPNGPEERPVNDMDYDFDVPLPPAPPGATSDVQVSVTTHPGDTVTGLKEVVTYTNPDPVTGLPTTAHIHLPYRGSGDGVYARTLKFYWDAFSPPGRHFVVKMKDVKLVPVTPQPASPGRWNLWTEICGQWAFLTGLNLDGFTSPQLQFGKAIDGLDAATFDVFLDDADTLRVFSQGYEAHSFEPLFGVDVGKPVYDVGVDLLKGQYLGSGENVDLGGALFQSFTNTTSEFEGVQGTHSVSASPADYTFVVNGINVPAHVSVFSTDFTVTYVPRPARIQVVEVPVNFGSVCLGTSAERPVRIYNIGEETLGVSDIAVSGDGFSRPPTPSLPFTITGGGYVDFTVRFSPTDTTQGTGFLTVTSTDPCQPPLTFELNAATPTHPVAQLSGSLEFGILPVGNHAPRSSQVLNFSINNSGVCPLIVNSIAVTAGDTADFQILPFFSTDPISIVPGGSLSVPVQFNPTKGGHRSATISVTPGNDPTNPGPLTITANGGAPLHAH